MDVKKEDIPDLIKVGEVSSVDTSKCTARVVFDDEDGIVSYDLPVLQRNAYANQDYQMPEIGEDVLCLFLGKGQEDGFIIGSFYAGDITPPESSTERRTVVFKDGTRVCYDREAHELRVTIDGTEVVFDRQNGVIKVPKAFSVECTTALVHASESVMLDTPKTDITGVLNVAGLITGKGGLAISGGSGASVDGSLKTTGDVNAGGISLQGHTHTGVHGETSPAH